jgi:hypothetical protein
MANVRTPISRRNVWKRSVTMRSGETNSNRTRPARSSAAAKRLSFSLRVESTRRADTSAAVRLSTWSFINEMSGETTTVVSVAR